MLRPDAQQGGAADGAPPAESHKKLQLEKSQRRSKFSEIDCLAPPQRVRATSFNGGTSTTRSL